MHSVLDPKQMWSPVATLAVVLKMPVSFADGHSLFLQPDWLSAEVTQRLTQRLRCGTDTALSLLHWCTVNLPSHVLASLRSLELVLPQESPTSHFACCSGCCLECWSTSSWFCLTSCDLSLGLSVEFSHPMSPFRLALSQGRVWPSLAY